MINWLRWLNKLSCYFHSKQSLGRFFSTFSHVRTSECRKRRKIHPFIILSNVRQRTCSSCHFHFSWITFTQNITCIRTTTYRFAEWFSYEFRIEICEVKCVVARRITAFHVFTASHKLEIDSKIIYGTIRFSRLELTLNWAGVEHANILMTDSPIKFQRKNVFIPGKAFV